MAEKGNISIHAQNIMPVIKRWLYSDKDIFLRELVSNGCDAIAKYRLLAQKGEAEAGQDYRVDVVADEAAGTLTVSDNGIGMTADEVKRYIAQVAFSGAEEFLQKYKPEEGESGGIIGHFGLGFYSAFMVSKKVVIDTLSYQPGAEAVRWSSEDGMEYEMEPSQRTERGSSITLYITDEDHEYLHMHTLRATLEKYCAFMPIPIYLSEVKPPEAEKKEDAAQDEAAPAAQPGEKKDEPVQVNDTTPLWMKRPADVTDEEYKNFYHKVFHDFDEPLFWIHLNAEYPFNLKGILYFPRIKNEFSSSEGVIKLYNNQVFVADNIKEVIPEFLMLLKGAIDCPDLPLNVSRSFLQNDGYVKKMSAYITRKVADRLVSEFNNHREDYEKYWDDIHPFVKYGCMRDEKFYERVKDVILFKTVEGKYLTLKEYQDANFTGDNKTVYYASDEKRQAQMIELFRGEGRDVVLLNTLIDNNFISFLEYHAGGDAISFKRVDAGIDGLTEEGESSEESRKALEEKFRKALGDDALDVTLERFKSSDLPAMITVDEQSRRFTEMSRMWGRDMHLPEKRTLTLNAKHPLINYIQTCADEDTLGLVCNQVLDLAEMARQPLESDRMVNFLSRSNKLLTMLVENRQN